MEKEFRLRQGNSYIFRGELRDNCCNVLQLSNYDTITILITSPTVHKVVIREPDYRIEDNKIIFSLSSIQTRLFERFVRIEAELKKGDSTVIGVYDKNISVESNNISKL